MVDPRWAFHETYARTRPIVTRRAKRSRCRIGRGRQLSGRAPCKRLSRRRRASSPTTRRSRRPGRAALRRQGGRVSASSCARRSANGPAPSTVAFSLVPGGAAVSAAGTLRPVLRPGAVFVDLNSITAAMVGEIAAESSTAAALTWSTARCSATSAPAAGFRCCSPGRAASEEVRDLHRRREVRAGRASMETAGRRLGDQDAAQRAHEGPRGAVRRVPGGRRGPGPAGRPSCGPSATWMRTPLRHHHGGADRHPLWCTPPGASARSNASRPCCGPTASTTP